MKTFKGPFYSATVNMIRSVTDFANAPENSSTTESIPAFENVITQLTSNVTTVDTLKQTATEQITGYAAQKRAAKKTLVQISTTIMKSVYAYAAETENNVLADQMKTSKSALQRMSYTDLANFAQNALNIVTPIISSLTDYNVTSSNLTDWQTDITALVTILSSANNAIANRKSTNRQIQLLLVSSMELLVNDADTLANQFTQSNVPYYLEYLANRKLKPTGHISTQLRMHVVNQQGFPVSSGEVLIVGTDRSGFLDLSGYCLVDYIPFGTHDVMLTTPWGTFTYPSILFKLGHSKTMHVQILTNASSEIKVTDDEIAETVSTAKSGK